MRIEIVRSGGLAGVRRRVVVDSAALPDAERRALEGMVEEAGFFALPRRLAGAARDAFQYDVTVETEGARHEVSVDESEAPAPLRTLLRRVLALGGGG